MVKKKAVRPRLLIEEWLPIAALGEESVRERRSMTALPPTYYLHVWWARRPLVASRAAILASLLPANADQAKFLHMLGIHGDPVATRKRIDTAKRTGEDLGQNIYGYNRAFTYVPSDEEVEWLRSESAKLGLVSPTLLDPTAGGGSIPFEGVRLGLNIVANDLNTVAWLILKATVEFPSRFGANLLHRFHELADRFKKSAERGLKNVFPSEPEGVTVDGYLWARTITCPYCGGLVPLSPNWKLDGSGAGVRLVPRVKGNKARCCGFEVVEKTKDQSVGTVKGGDGLCPFPDCGRVIDGDEIKKQAQVGDMGQQLYAVVFKRNVKVGVTKGKVPKDKFKTIRGFRAPLPKDDVSAQINAALAAKMPEWRARNIVPNEERYIGPADRSANYGMTKHVDLFFPRQLFGHCNSVQCFHDLVDELRQEQGGEISDTDKAALSYLAIAIDKSIDWNSRLCTWHPTRQVVGHTFQRHDFAIKWSVAEMAAAVTGLGYDWVLKSTEKCIRELIELVGLEPEQPGFFDRSKNLAIRIGHGSGDDLKLQDGSVDCIVMDPPYYDNVMYAELADFFYVWLKRTAGLLFPAEFANYLCDKDREAIANPEKFKGQVGGARNLAGRDYQERMASIFRECRRVIKPHGVLTVMFTHKASGAWDALASGLVDAGWAITASWPVNTEAEDSLHIKEKSAAKSTIFLVCRPREAAGEDADAVYWEEVEPRVMAAVRQRVKEFQAAGIGGVDLYLACFGPALQVFSENWPLKRGRPIQKPREIKLVGDEEWDPYAVRPEDALDAARKEVKRWRMEQLATVKRQHHLDPVTEWYVLAWDAFKAPRFPSDEALKLARVVGLDFDTQVKNVVCEVKSSDVILWDSKVRQSKGRLGPMGEALMLDTLHRAAAIVREQNTGAARKAIQEAGLDTDATLLTAMEALLNVLPAMANPEKATKADPSIVGASSDFDALEKLRRLGFADSVPTPIQKTLYDYVEDDTADDADE
jgi:putative DNA methylase